MQKKNFMLFIPCVF